jgi:hypothetical protein
MVDHRKTHVSRAAWLALAVIAVAALLSVVASHASAATPYMSITAWQKDKLGGTEFRTCPIKQQGGKYFLVRRLLAGERYESIVKKYCDAAGINEDDCKAATGLAAAYHAEEHTHKNWQPFDRIYLNVPDAIAGPPPEER